MRHLTGPELQEIDGSHTFWVALPLDWNARRYLRQNRDVCLPSAFAYGLVCCIRSQVHNETHLEDTRHGIGASISERSNKEGKQPKTYGIHPSLGALAL